jgi:CDP-diacylglycerol--glycerol-3-phosphate 3-phosphatidyltransferase
VKEPVTRGRTFTLLPHSLPRRFVDPVLVAAALDLLDGALARATGRVTRFGGVFDSVLDRLGEAAVLGGVLFHFSEGGHRQEVVLAYIAVVGSILVSYVRARAEAAGLSLKEGLFTRPERVIVLGVGLMVGQMLIALWILAVVSVFTALQRLYAAWRGLANLPPGGR